MAVLSFLQSNVRCWDFMPTKENTKVTSRLSGSDKVNEPSIPVVTPIGIPSTRTVAPGNGCFCESHTVPERVTIFGNAATCSFPASFSFGEIMMTLSSILKSRRDPPSNADRISLTVAFFRSIFGAGNARTSS